MRPKSRREQAILAFVAATTIIVIGAIALGSNPWGVVFMVIIMAIGALAIRDN